VETVPWHPAAPSATHTNPTMPKDCYFEAHFNIVVDKDEAGRLRSLEGRYGFHLSRNAFKKVSDTEFVMMATKRNYEGTYEQFKKECDWLVEEMEGDGFTVPKTINEFSVYDTNINHDEEWIGEDARNT